MIHVLEAYRYFTHLDVAPEFNFTQVVSWSLGTYPVYWISATKVIFPVASTVNSRLCPCDVVAVHVPAWAIFSFFRTNLQGIQRMVHQTEEECIQLELYSPHG